MLPSLRKAGDEVFFREKASLKFQGGLTTAWLVTRYFCTNCLKTLYKKGKKIITQFPNMWSWQFTLILHPFSCRAISHHSQYQLWMVRKGAAFPFSMAWLHARVTRDLQPESPRVIGSMSKNLDSTNVLVLGTEPRNNSGYPCTLLNLRFWQKSITTTKCQRDISKSIFST